MRQRWHRVWWGLRQEFTWGREEVVEGRWAWWLNVLAYRVMAVWPWLAKTYGSPYSSRTFRLVTRQGAVVHYRAHRGDVQGIREIFIDEIYRLPLGLAPLSLVDLGANIGLASVWLGTTYPLARIIAVEPIAENVSLLRRNAEANGLSLEIFATAVGPESGRVHFADSPTTNMGRVTDQGGTVVAVTALSDVLARVTLPQALLKMDIEGMEGPLLTQLDPSWVRTFAVIVMEMHPEYVNVGELVEAITRQGFDYTESYEITEGFRRRKRERLFVQRPS